MYKFNRALWIVLFKADKLLKSTTDGDKLFHTDTTLSAKYCCLTFMRQLFTDNLYVLPLVTLFTQRRPNVKKTYENQYLRDRI